MFGGAPQPQTSRNGPKRPKTAVFGVFVTGTYSKEAYGERWQAVLSDERETRRRRLESGLPMPMKSGNHEYDQYVALSQRVLGRTKGFEQLEGLGTTARRR